MSLELAAQHLASRGRKGDTMLVHMAPQEVSGLQALARAHGGTLTVNPDTGLPEANFLKRMLPMLIGAGLMFATGGTAAPLIAGISNPALIGLGIGGLETARTGSLEKGLMAGLGAYGGAGLTGGLLGAGAAEAAIPGAAPVIPGAPTMFPTDPSAYNAFTPTSSNFGAMGETFAAAPAPSVTPNLYGGVSGDYGLPLVDQSATSALTAGAPPVAAPISTATTMPTVASPAYGTEAANAAAQQQAANATVGDRFAQAGKGLSSLGSEAGRSAALSSMGGGMGAAKYGLAALSPMLQAGEAKPFDGGGPNPYEYTYDPNAQRYTRVPPGTRQRDILAPTTQMAAAGGPIEEMSDRNQMETMMANGGQMFAAGGISNLGDYSDGGRLLKGPGDGVSDSIPATIADKRPARLADGEFVVPARIVSELGNGSTEAGARKLYAMMDRVQKARGKTTGKNRVAVNSRAEKLLPA